MSLAHHDVNTYNSDGRIIQVEYAMKAMNLGTTTIGAVLKDSVILVSEKKLLSSLQNPLSVQKHFKIYDSILAGISGISGDAPAIINRCREFCIQHEQLFDEQIGVDKLMDKICALAMKFGEDDLQKKIFSRPFGVSILAAALDNGKPVLYNIDPSGSYYRFRAKAIGSAQEVVETALVEQYREEDSTDDCLRKMLRILKDVMKDSINKYNVEASIVNREAVEILTPDRIAEYLE